MKPDNSFPDGMEQAVDDVLVAVHDALADSANGERSPLERLAELSETLGRAGTIARHIAADRLTGRASPSLETTDGEPRWLSYRDVLIELAGQALEACRLLSHPSVPGASDPHVATEILLPLSYRAMRERGAAIHLGQEIDVWHLQLVSELGEIASELLRVDTGDGTSLPNPSDLILQKLDQDALAGFREVGRAGVKCLDFAALAMLGAAACATSG